MKDVVRMVSAGIVMAFFATLIYAVFLQRGPSHAVAFKSRYDNRYETAQRKSVLVETTHGQGTGVVIKRANSRGDTRVFVWTAAHVVEGVDKAKVRVVLRASAHKAGEAAFEATVIFRPATDAALLWVDADPRFFDDAQFDFREPHVGMSVYHVGNLMGELFDGSVTTGVVSQIGVKPRMEGWRWPVLDQSDALMWHGSSGGPVFSHQNKVVGLCVAGPELPGISCYLPTREILKAVGKLTWTMQGDYCPADDLLSTMEAIARWPKPKVDMVPIIVPIIEEQIDCRG